MTIMANMSSNGTLSSFQYFRPYYDAPLIVLALFIVMINVLVITLFIRKSYLRTKTNSILVSLAISDLIAGLVTIPFYIFCPAVPNLCIISGVLYRCIAVSTIAHILVVTLERYVAVIYPMRYYRMVTKQRVCIVIAIVWVFSVVYAMIPLTWIDLLNYKLADERRKFDIPYQITGFVVCFSLPLVIMIVCFTRMFIVIRHQVENMRRQVDMSGDPRNRSIASDKRALMIFSAMLGIFVLCWLSWYITMFEVNFDENTIFPIIVVDILDFLRFGTSLFNPLLYTFLKHDFRRAARSKCSCFEKLTKLFAPRDSNSNIRVTMVTELNGKTHPKSNSLNSNLQVCENNEKDKRESEIVELISRV